MKRLIENTGLYLYRLPSRQEIIFGKGDIIEGIDNGFVYSPFISSSKRDIHTITARLQASIWYEDLKEIFNEFSHASSLGSSQKANHSVDGLHISNQSEYTDKIIEIRNFLQKENPDGKVVFSRRIPFKHPLLLDRVFKNLCLTYPDAFIFCFSTPEYGLWIGASPELLIEGDSEIIRSMALAGTRAADSSQDSDWDIKNQEEHQIVIDYIRTIFSLFKINSFTGERFTKKAGPVEHLCTPIAGILPNTFDLGNFLIKLSPTPALCGSVSRIEVPLIKQLEDNDRELYGGWCGPYEDLKYHFFVNLRSAKIFLGKEDLSALLFSGGGITLKSDPLEEWNETERKASTLLKIFKNSI